MNKFTIVRGKDGFGSQLLSILSGMAVAHKRKDTEYVHTRLNGIRLLDKGEDQNTDLVSANEMLDELILRCGYKIRNQSDLVEEFPFFHYHIRNEGFDEYYTSSFCEMISSAYSMPYPKDFDKNQHHISVHIRRGTDIFREEDIQSRIVPTDVYSALISKIQSLNPNSIIHIFSWGDPKLNLDNVSPNIRYHIVENGDLFLEDFNRMVHSDVLFVGNSTLSVSAGLLSKGKVFSIPSVSNSKLTTLPILKSWKKDYEDIYND